MHHTQHLWETCSNYLCSEAMHLRYHLQSLENPFHQAQSSGWLSYNSWSRVLGNFAACRVFTNEDSCRTVKHSVDLCKFEIWEYCRYIISLAHAVTPAFVSRTLQEEFPDFDIQDGEEAEVEDKMDNSKARKELLISSIAPEVTLRDMARTMLLLKMANPKTR